MKLSLLEKLADPIERKPLSLESSNSGTETFIENGILRAVDGATYPIVDGIPRFVLTGDIGQAQTSKAFGFKWKKRDTYDSPAARKAAADWYLEKYGFDSLDAWAAYFDSRASVIDIGSGSGFSSSLFLESRRWTGRAMWVGVDISEAIDVAAERLASMPNTHFVQGDALQLPFGLASFDTVFSEGVLHHTPSTRQALLSAASVLASGGEANVYVYKKKAPLREFTDDFIREQIAPLSDEEAWDAMRSLTELGQALHATHATVDLAVDVPLLGIKAGKHDVQRLIYWNFAKLFWNADLAFEENVHINFDWYRPRYAHRQTEQQVRAWCEEAGLVIQRLHDSEAGFTVRAVKR
ncbi:MAG TPA: methyltransferase domain-containing protein [Thermoanaerobaculia bacterium]|nr:methyltransferase domain-containing protein [Thermoanaerobaculia bacterium]